jgi:hypothetical protein
MHGSSADGIGSMKSGRCRAKSKRTKGEHAKRKSMRKKSSKSKSSSSSSSSGGGGSSGSSSGSSKSDCSSDASGGATRRTASPAIDCVPAAQHTELDVEHLQRLSLSPLEHGLTENTCDVVLPAQEAHFNAHSVVLAARCPYYRALLRFRCEGSQDDGEGNESTRPKRMLSLPVEFDPSPRGMLLLLRFLYGGWLVGNDDKVGESTGTDDAQHTIEQMGGFDFASVPLAVIKAVAAKAMMGDEQCVHAKGIKRRLCITALPPLHKSQLARGEGGGGGGHCDVEVMMELMVISNALILPELQRACEARLGELLLLLLCKRDCDDDPRGLMKMRMRLLASLVVLCRRLQTRRLMRFCRCVARSADTDPGWCPELDNIDVVEAWELQCDDPTNEACELSMAMTTSGESSFSRSFCARVAIDLTQLWREANDEDDDSLYVCDAHFRITPESSEDPLETLSPVSCATFPLIGAHAALLSVRCPQLLLMHQQVCIASSDASIPAAVVAASTAVVLDFVYSGRVASVTLEARDESSKQGGKYDEDSDEDDEESDEEPEEEHGGRNGVSRKLLTPAAAMDTMITAHEYGMLELVRHCENMLVRFVNVDNVLELWRSAKFFRRARLARCCCLFILQHFEEVLGEPAEHSELVMELLAPLQRRARVAREATV